MRGQLRPEYGQEVIVDDQNSKVLGVVVSKMIVGVKLKVVVPPVNYKQLVVLLQALRRSSPWHDLTILSRNSPLPEYLLILFNQPRLYMYHEQIFSILYLLWDLFVGLDNP